LYAVILGVYAAVALLWLVAVLRGPLPRWGDWASTAVDLLVIITLCLVSGGATAAFQDRPSLTAIIGTVTAVGYLAVWIFYSKRDDKVGLPNMVYTHFGFLLWLAVAVTALCFVLARRSARVRALQEMRRHLVSEAMQSDERHNREVAEHLHDGPLQTLLAARLELDEARERNPDPALDMVYAALQETATGLRSTGDRDVAAGTGHFSRLSGETPCDDEALNLVGALEDLGDLGLAHVALDAVIPRVAGTAEHLNGVGGDLHRGVGGHQLGHTGLSRIRPAQIASAGGI
jgi:hypothetical protein